MDVQVIVMVPVVHNAASDGHEHVSRVFSLSNDEQAGVFSNRFIAVIHLNFALPRDILFLLKSSGSERGGFDLESDIPNLLASPSHMEHQHEML